MTMLESYLISVAIKSTVLLAAGLLCLRLLRGRDAAVRHLVCLVALGSAALAPLLALWSPQWSLLISVPAAAGAARGGSDVAIGVWSLPMTLAALWALGTVVMAVRAIGGWSVLLRARRRSRHFQDGEAAEVRIGKVSTPLTCGALWPLILLPEGAQDWDEQRLGRFCYTNRHTCAGAIVWRSIWHRGCARCCGGILWPGCWWFV